MAGGILNGSKSWIQFAILLVAIAIAWGGQREQTKIQAKAIEVLSTKKLDEAVFVECVKRLDGSLIDLRINLRSIDEKMTKLLDKE